MCRDESVTLFRTGSLVTGNGLPPSSKVEAKIYMLIHAILPGKFACTNVTPKNKNKNDNNNNNNNNNNKKKNGGETLTHAATTHE